MNQRRRIAVIGTLAFSAALFATTTASAAFLSTTGSTTYGAGTIQARSTVTATFHFNGGGALECSSSSSSLYSSLGNGSVNASTGGVITSSYQQLISFASGAGGMLFGNSMASTQTTSSACSSTYANIPNCTVRPFNASFQMRTNSAGIDVQTGPWTFTADCIASNGTSIPNCVYTTGPGTPAAVVGYAPYVGIRASEITFPSAATATGAASGFPFYKITGPSPCPAATVTQPGGFKAKYKLYTSSSGSTQVHAYQ